jgi:hypothetical protein
MLPMLSSSCGLVAVDTSMHHTPVHPANAARIDDAELSAQVVVPKVLGPAFVPLYR